MSMTTNATAELLDLSARLLRSIQDGDWKTYAELCDPTLTCFEPEALGHLVEGMEFHRFYFNLERTARPVNNTISSPHVRLLGDDAAVVSYVRLVQSVDDAGKAHTRQIEETRVWERNNGKWRHVHFHRSLNQ
jgi:calcium/calmodulin-dependent protein kinase (CaM kinase) II